MPALTLVDCALRSLVFHERCTAIQAASLLQSEATATGRLLEETAYEYLAGEIALHCE